MSDGSLQSHIALVVDDHDMVRRALCDRIKATFRGASQAGVGVGLPLTFDGEMEGSLLEGKGEGEWSARLFAGRMPMSGTWRIDQVADGTGG